MRRRPPATMHWSLRCRPPADEGDAAPLRWWRISGPPMGRRCVTRVGWAESGAPAGCLCLATGKHLDRDIAAGPDGLLGGRGPVHPEGHDQGSTRRRGGIPTPQVATFQVPTPRVLTFQVPTSQVATFQVSTPRGPGSRPTPFSSTSAHACASGRTSSRSASARISCAGRVHAPVHDRRPRLFCRWP